MKYRSKQLLGESWNTLSPREKSQILESEKVFTEFFQKISYGMETDYLIVEGLMGNMANAVKSKFGTQDKSKQINKIFDNFKNDMVKITQSMDKDFGSLGNPELQKLPSSLSNTVKDLNLTDTSLSTKLKTKGQEVVANKLLPAVNKAVSALGNQIEKLYQKSGPIKDFDDKYKQLVQQLSSKYPAISGKISEFSKIASKHKGKATFTVGALTALLTVAGAAGPIAPVIIGIGMRGIFGMLAGEPPAKSFGKATITALVGKLVGMGVKEFFNGIFDGISADGVEGDVGIEADTSPDVEADAQTETTPTEPASTPSYGKTPDGNTWFKIDGKPTQYGEFHDGGLKKYYVVQGDAALKSINPKNHIVDYNTYQNIVNKADSIDWLKK